MQQTFIPLCQALHIRSDPYWYWDACFDSEKDWDAIIEREQKELQLRWQAVIEKQQEEMRKWYVKFEDDNNRALATWEAQVRGRLVGMSVTFKGKNEYSTHT